MTTVTSSYVPVWRFADNNNNPLVGGKVYTYYAGTTTPAATYTDATGSTPLTNPIILNARGETANASGASCSVWFSTTIAYKIVVQDSSGNLIWTVDNYTIPSQAYSAAYADTFTATAGQTVFTLTGTVGSQSALDVSLDGATLVNGVDFTWTSPSTLTLTVGAKAGQILLVKYLIAQAMGTMVAGGTSGQILYNNGGSVQGFTMSGDVTVVPTTGVATVNAPSSHITYTQGGTGATSRTVTSKLQESVSVLDFGADPTGNTDSTTAIQNAIAYAHSLSLGTVTDPEGNQNAGSLTVYFPAGKYTVSGKISMYESTALQGAGRLSTLIVSSYNGNIVESQPAASYNAYGMAICDMQIVGNRTLTSQVGIALLRPFSMFMRNVGVNSCGSDGILARQALVCEWHNIEVTKCVGSGIRFTDGTNSWTDTTPTNLPSNANMLFNVFTQYNDAAGITHSSLGTAGVNGNIYHGGASQYNYASSSSGTGYNIEILDTNYTPSEFVDFWCEGPVNAHVHVNMGNSGCVVRFTRFHHFGNGASNYPNRAIINDKGVCFLESPFGHSTQYRNVTGSGGTSKAPFRINKGGGVADYYINNAYGSTVTGNLFVEDENQNTTGLSNQVPGMNNFGNLYGNGPTFTVAFGTTYPAVTQEGQSYPQCYFRTWDATNGSAAGWAFGSGSVAADTNLIRYGAGVLGMGAGNSFQLNGASGAVIRYANGTANGSVATTLGSVGPTGSTAGNPQGWLRVNIAGTDRYIPYW